jgi:hypothetical protein
MLILQGFVQQVYTGVVTYGSLYSLRLNMPIYFKHLTNGFPLSLTSSTSLTKHTLSLFMVFQLPLIALVTVMISTTFFHRMPPSLLIHQSFNMLNLSLIHPQLPQNHTPLSLSISLILTLPMLAFNIMSPSMVTSGPP